MPTSRFIYTFNASPVISRSDAVSTQEIYYLVCPLSATSICSLLACGNTTSVTASVLTLATLDNKTQIKCFYNICLINAHTTCPVVNVNCVTGHYKNVGN